MARAAAASFVDGTPHRLERIWYEDPAGFVEPARLLTFFPVKGMTLDEQLNATLRFSVYFAAVLLIGGRGSHVLFFPIAVAAGTYLMHVSARNNERVMREGLGPEARESRGRTSGQPSADRCVRPTRDNPFMNVLSSDYALRPTRGSACDMQDPRVAKTAEAMFVKTSGSLVGTLVRDSDDIYHRRASSRQFVTNPSTTIPNDQSAFANWLYGKPPQGKAVGSPFRT